MGKSLHHSHAIRVDRTADHVSLAQYGLEKRWYSLDRLALRGIIETIIDTSRRGCHVHHSRRSPALEVPVVSEQ